METGNVQAKDHKSLAEAPYPLPAVGTSFRVVSDGHGLSGKHVVLCAPLSAGGKTALVLVTEGVALYGVQHRETVDRSRLYPMRWGHYEAPYDAPNKED